MFTFCPDFEAATLKLPAPTPSSQSASASAALSQLSLLASAGGDINPPFYTPSHYLDPSLGFDPYQEAASSAALAQSLGVLSSSNAAGSRKQIIGFAKFKTRSAALEARDALQGRKVDVERASLLKAEMAKKNLHTRRGVGGDDGSIGAAGSGVGGGGSGSGGPRTRMDSVGGNGANGSLRPPVPAFDWDGGDISPRPLSQYPTPLYLASNLYSTGSSTPAPPRPVSSQSTSSNFSDPHASNLPPPSFIDRHQRQSSAVQTARAPLPAEPYFTSPPARPFAPASDPSSDGDRLPVFLPGAPYRPDHARASSSSRNAGFKIRRGSPDYTRGGVPQPPVTEPSHVDEGRRESENDLSPDALGHGGSSSSLEKASADKASRSLPRTSNPADQNPPVRLSTLL